MAYQIASKPVFVPTDANFSVSRGEYAIIYADTATTKHDTEAVKIELIVTPSGRVIVAANGPIELVDFDAAGRLMSADAAEGQLPLFDKDDLPLESLKNVRPQSDPIIEEKPPNSLPQSQP